MRHPLAIALTLAGLMLAGCAQNVPSAVLRTATAPVEASVAAAQPERSLMAMSSQALSPISERQATVVRNVRYGRSAEQALDVYGTSERRASRPVVVWVHGGGWKMGDKGNDLEAKRAYFKSLGYVFVSTNYRLADPNVPVGRRAMHPDQIRDVCAAIGWVKQNIAAHGGDPQAIALMGHSAGAHLVSLAGTHAKYLAEAVGRVGLGSLRGVVSVDTSNYDLINTNGPWIEELVLNAFGKDRAVRRDASPLYQVDSGRQTPPFLVFVQGSAERIREARQFHDLTRQADPLQRGDQFQHVTAYNHMEINEAIGRPGERLVTPAITAFLKQMFGR
ncbi:MAG: alpha/beta hydrolase [Candidatus Sericytochromatia bacterium]|nr:alpha/beta hydrolase [Candidatus Sericytochromatia bacterium]